MRRHPTQRPAERKTPRLPYVTAALGAVLIAFSAIFVRLSEAAPTTAAVYRCAYAVPALAALAYLEQRRYGPRPRRERLLAAVAGFFFAADLTMWHYSIEMIGAGLATVIANIQIVLVGLLAWLILGERPARAQVFAVPTVLAGLVLVSGALDTNPYGSDPLLGAVLGVLTAVAYSAFLLVLRHGNRDIRRPVGPLLDATLASAVFATIFGVALGTFEPVPQFPGHLWLILLALTCQVIAYLLISISLPRLPALTTSIILMLQPVGSVVLAMLILGEQPSALQLAGVVLILAGILAGAMWRSHPRSVA